MLQFETYHVGSDLYLVKPVKSDKTKLTKEETEALVKHLNDMYAVGDGTSPLDMNPK